jgi:hypothetical protein
MSWSKKPYFWAGIAVRTVCAPFLLQWFHPDERQMLEFAHFQAHGRLHPFLESRLHLRNQTFPWLESWLIRLCDALGFHTPWAYLTLTHLVLSVLSWVSLAALVEYFAERNPESTRESRILGWIFALFWIFPWLYSRQLSEAVSLIPTVWLFLAIQRRQFARAGIWAGLTSIFRYPSALWVVGGFLLLLASRANRRKVKPWIAAALGFLVVLGLGGLADLHTYGKFLESAPAYWNFNRPHGPVEAMFGNDGLDTYLHWFDFILTPWLGGAFILVALFALSNSNSLFIFTLPYIAGHIWTPHREPRFMLPLTPFLILAIAEFWVSTRFQTAFERFRLREPKILRVLATAMWVHIAFNFAWYPLNAWAQWTSAQGTLTRHYKDLAAKPTRFITLADPVIDALMPQNTRWANSECQWHRAPLKNEAASRVWILSEDPPQSCIPAVEDLVPTLTSRTLQRLLRVRVARLWECNDAALQHICPTGIKDNPAGEPLANL